MPSAFLRSTPFRLTVLLGAAFLAALAIAGVTAFQLIRHELDVRIDRNVADTFSVISQAYGERDVADLADSVTSHATATLQHDRVYALVDASGKLVVGNVRGIPTLAGLGWSVVSASALGVTDASDDYRVFVGEVGEFKMLVGLSFNETNAIGRLAFTSLAWAGGLFVVLVVGTGIVVAAQAQKRLDRIAVTMQRVGRGELTARIAISGRGDDIDALVSDVNSALDRLAALVEGMRQVSMDIAHDLKTPLNRLAIIVESAIEAEAHGRPLGTLLAQAEEESGRINATFDALLRIAQIESGARRARFASVAPGAILDTILDAYGEVAIEQGQTLQLNKGRDLGEITGDRELLVQMLANLVENAINHSRPGTTITLTGRFSDGHLELVVADTGPGIPEVEYERVFQRLYRLEKSRTSPGNGLGLSLVKAIAELHGASVALGDNRPGLSVTIRFPRADADLHPNP